MFNITALSPSLQPSTFLNPKRRFKRRKETLITAFKKVKDGRDPRGKRHPLESILFLVLFGVSLGGKNLTECIEKAKKHRKFLLKILDLAHGIPHPTTISRAFQVCDVDSLVQALQVWQQQIFGGLGIGEGISLDGKTLGAVYGDDVVKHLFTATAHTTQRLLGQVGVTQKENEITACPKLLDQVGLDLWGTIVTADAMLTQKNILKQIREKGAQYLLTVKSNTKELLQIIESQFNHFVFEKQEHRSFDAGHGREQTTMVEISNDCDMEDLGLDWQDIAWIGRVRRTGRRPYYQRRKHTTRLQPFDEISYFIASEPDLSAEQAAGLVRGHWGIENRSFWQRDWTYLEDRQTLRKGNAPQVMSALRNFWLGVLREQGKTEISKTLRLFDDYPKEHRQFLRKTHIY